MPILYPPQQEIARQYFNDKNIPVVEGMRNLKNLLSLNVLIKIGGDCLDNGGYELIGQNISDLYQIGIIPTLVHGGSTQISKAMERNGIKPKFINDLRMVPGQQTLDSVVEGLKEVNNGLVSAINAYSGPNIAVGLMDEQIIHAEKYPTIIDKISNKEVDLGLVGNVRKIEFNMINSYTRNGKIPVLWCIGYEEDGQKYNINADNVGESLAPNFGKYILLTSIVGYLNERGNLVPEMTLEEARKHKATGGMSIKLDSVIAVLDNTNLESVQIASPENLPYELLLDKGGGTIIKKDN